MKEKETSYALQAANLDPMFLWHLLGMLSVKDEDWLEAAALEYMEIHHKDTLKAGQNPDSPLTHHSN